MADLVRILVAVLLGVLVGLLVTIRSLDPTDRGVTAGPWHGTPKEGTGEIDPYALAAVARASLLPLGSAEGLSFIAMTDSAGRSLDASCEYDVRGPMPPARFWTLTLLTREGFPAANPAQRYGFSSSEVLRHTDEPVSIRVSSEARSGNWLPTGDARTYVLMLRLYDTSLSTTGTVFKSAIMPAIKRETCR